MDAKINNDGFEFGSAKITRYAADDEKRSVLLGLETPAHKGHKALQIHINKRGKVRISDIRGEWTPPKAK